MACFNAVISKPKENGKIYAINIKAPEKPYEKRLDGQIYNVISADKLARMEKTPYDLDRTLFVEPPYMDQRIIAQHGLFCCFKEPTIPLDKPNPPFKIRKGDTTKTEMDVIMSKEKPSGKKDEIRRELNCMGIIIRPFIPI